MTSSLFEKLRVLLNARATYVIDVHLGEMQRLKGRFKDRIVWIDFHQHFLLVEYRRLKALETTLELSIGKPFKWMFLNKKIGTTIKKRPVYTSDQCIECATRFVNDPINKKYIHSISLGKKDFLAVYSNGLMFCCQVQPIEHVLNTLNLLIEHNYKPVFLNANTAATLSSSQSRSDFIQPSKKR